MEKEHSERPLLNIGMEIVIFSREEKELYKSIFLNKEIHSSFMEEFRSVVHQQMEKDARFDNLDEFIKEKLLVGVQALMPIFL